MDKKISISVIIPAFNERKRLPSFLRELISYCNSSQRTYEIIIVDDGSTDDTYKEALKFQVQFPTLQVHRLEKNKGVGYATKEGFFISKGIMIVFIDADGSVHPGEIEKNIFYFEGGYDIIIGSRAIRTKAQTVRIPFYRMIPSLFFNFLVQCFLFKGIKDTQSGFMLCKRRVMEELLPKMYIQRFGFYIELLYLAYKMGYKVKETPVSWQHKAGTKVNLMRDSLTMLLNIFKIRRLHSGSEKNKRSIKGG